MAASGLPCRGCGTLKAVASDQREKLIAEGGPLCHDCRRAEREQAETLFNEIRAKRVLSLPVQSIRRGRRSGRSGTGGARYRKNRLIVLSASDVCGICGHPGAATVDHIIPVKRWTGEKGAHDNVENLQPAHGSLGSLGLVNRCPVCDRLCNQSKGARLV